MGAKEMCRKLLACAISAGCLLGSVAAADMNGDSPVSIEAVTVQDNYGLSVTRATKLAIFR